MELPQAKSKESVRHPVEVLQASSAKAEWARRLHEIRVTQGYAAAARRAMDNAVLSKIQRIGGLPSSHTLYHSYNGTLTDLDIQDVYGLPENDPNVQRAPRACFEREFYGEELTIKTLKL